MTDHLKVHHSPNSSKAESNKKRKLDPAQATILTTKKMDDKSADLIKDGFKLTF